MTLKLHATHLAPPAYAHLKEFVVLSGNWQIGSISEERAGKGWFWALGVGTPFDPDKVKMHASIARHRQECQTCEIVHRWPRTDWAMLVAGRRAHRSNNEELRLWPPKIALSN
jgi:hypothetical protein